MRRTFDDIDNAFRAANRGYEEEPSAAVWNNINDVLELEGINKKRKSWKPFFLVLLLIVGPFIKEGSVVVKLVPVVQTAAERPGHTVVAISKSSKDKKENKTGITVWVEQDSREGEYMNNEYIKNKQPKISTIPFFAEVAIPTPTPFTLRQKNNHRVSKWTISGMVAYGYSAYRIDSDLPSNQQQAKMIREREDPEMSYSAGLTATYWFRPKLGLQAGIVFSNTQISISPQKMYALSNPDGDIAYQFLTSAGYAYVKPPAGNIPVIGDSLTTAESQHQLKTVAVPVSVKFNTGGARWRFNPGIGIAANFVTSSKIETEIEDAGGRETVVINKLHGTKNFFWSLHADAELQYRVNTKMSVNIKPSVVYAISPITENTFIETFPYTISLGIGLTYKF